MVLLVIDVQKGITDERLYNYQEFIENTSRLIKTARENDVAREVCRLCSC